jgi:multidrug resistance efflux pump
MVELRSSFVALILLSTWLRTSEAAESAISANGRLEGAQQTAALFFAESGRLLSISAAEGQFFRKGELLAELDCSSLAAQLGAARARFDIAGRGGRGETVALREAELAVVEAEIARLEAELRRLVPLGQRDLTAKSILEDTELQLHISQARLNVARSALAETRNAMPREEVALERSQVDSLAARLHECTMTAPTDGVVLRRLLEPGASVSSLIPTPVLLFSDTHEWNARVELDEADVLVVHVGQVASITAPAFANGELTGVVTSVSPLMGRRTIRSGDPGEKMDRDVMEVLVRLDKPPPALVVGLRVTVRFQL